MSGRTLHVVRSARPETGGVATAVRHLTEALRARGDEATIVSLDPADRGRAGVTSLGRTSEGYGYTADFVPWLRTRAAAFDAVIVHGLWQYPGFGTRRALRATRTPFLVYCHGMLDPWFKRTYPLKHFKKWLYWPWAEYRVLRDAAAVCFTCEEERRAARESFALYRAKEHVTPLGIPAPAGDPEVERAAFLREYPGLARDKFLLFLGRIHPKKGVELLLHAFAAEGGPTETLVVAGPCAEESYRAGLERQARELGIAGRVHWLPMLDGEVKWGALRACEAFVLPSHQENFGVAVVEALACGRPVLISEQVNIWREIIADGAGLAAPDTVAGTTALLRRWRALDPAGRAEMGRRTTRCFAGRFSAARAAEVFAEVVANVSERRR